MLDRKLAEDAQATVGDTVQLETPIGRTESEVVGISSFGNQNSLDDGGTIWFDEDTAVEVLNAGTAGFSTVLVRTSAEPMTVAVDLQQQLPASVELVSRAEFVEDRASPRPS